MSDPRVVTATTLTELLFEEAAAGLCLVAPDGTVVRANAEWLRSTGFTAEQVVGENILDLFPATRDMALAMHARARAGHRVAVPRHAQNVNGRDTWWEGSIAPVPLDGGTGLLITAREVSPAGAAEIERRTDARYRTLFESMSEGFCVIEVLFDGAGKPTDYRFLEVNQAFERHTGLAHAAGRRMREIAPTLEEHWFEIFGRVARTGEPARFENRAEALGRWYDVYAYRVGTPEDRKVAVLFTDITDRKRNADALSHALREADAERRRLTAVLDALPAGVAIADATGRIVQFNDALNRIWGSPPVPQSAAEYREWRGWWPDSGKRLEAHEWAMARALSTGDVVVPGDVVEIERFDGSGRATILNAAAPIRNASGEIIGGVLAEVDITAQRRAEERLHDAVERYEQQARLFEGVTSTTPDFIYIFDLQGRFLYANRRLLEVWGMPLGDIVGKTPLELGYERWHHDLHMREIEQVAATRLPIKGEVPFTAPLTGVSGVYEYIFTPVLGAEGKVEVVAGTTRDVTERKRAEDALKRLAEERDLERARLDAVIENMEEAVGIWSADGNLVAINNATVRMYGFETKEQMLRHLSEYADMSVRTLDGRELPQDEWPPARALSGESFSNWELEHLLPSIHRRFIGSNSGAPVRDATGKIVLAVNTVHDVTALHEARRAAERALKDREQLVAELREADRRKDEFLGMLSHELRNPLAPIRNSTYVLQHAAPGSDQARRAQRVIQRQTEHLTRLVDDLLDVTRIARGKIELRRSRVDLRDVVARAAEDFRVLLQDRGVHLEATIPDEKLWADADATRVTQVVGNLLHNAAKFTRRGDTVSLTVRAMDGSAEIRVRDTGAGIEPELLPKMFDPFVQGERTLARTEGGLGLGLALVKGITTLHGGTVRADSAGKGRGSEFVVTLPLFRGPDVPSGAAALPVRRNGGRRVLVVDDNPDAADSLADMVRLQGHEVDVAYDGPTAIEKARANPPSIVLCDIGLPGMTGYEVARTLRASALEGVQLIAVSGYAQPEDVKRAIESGFDGHLAKPCDPDEIERLLG